METVVRIPIAVTIRGFVYQPVKNSTGEVITEAQHKETVQKTFSEEIKKGIKVKDFQLKEVDIKIS